MVDVVRLTPYHHTSILIAQVANHVGASHLQNWAPAAYNGPFDTSADYHPYCEPDWSRDDQIEMEQCESLVYPLSVQLKVRLAVWANARPQHRVSTSR